MYKKILTKHFCKTENAVRHDVSFLTPESLFCDGKGEAGRLEYSFLTAEKALPRHGTRSFSSRQSVFHRAGKPVSVTHKGSSA